jgi:hypothetical protein
MRHHVPLKGPRSHANAIGLKIRQITQGCPLRSLGAISGAEGVLNNLQNNPRTLLTPETTWYIFTAVREEVTLHGTSRLWEEFTPLISNGAFVMNIFEPALVTVALVGGAIFSAVVLWDLLQEFRGKN